MTTSLTSIGKLEGLITTEVGEYLYAAAGLVPETQAIVELGSYHGKSTAYLAAGAKAGNKQKVVAVDTWSEEVSNWRRAVAARLPSPSRATFSKQLSKVRLASRVDPWKSSTTAAAHRYTKDLEAGNRPMIGLLYIDADHNYNPVMQDYNRWSKLVAAGGMIVFDDYNESNPGVMKALQRLVDDGRITSFTIEAERLAVVEHA